jgi:O-antigen/teichoic acid export membrane protein
MITIVASSLAQFWMLLRFTSRAIKLQLIIDLDIWKRIMTKTWPIALSVIFTTIYFKGDAIILSLTRPYADVGIYGAAYKILEVLITLPILFMGLVLPHLARTYAENNKEQFNKFIQKAWDVISLITIPMIVGTLVLAKPIMTLIAGKGYEDSAIVLQILIIAAGIIFLGSLFTHAIVAVNQQKHMIKYYGVAAALAVILYILFIPTYTYYAAAGVTVVAELLIAVAAFIKVKKASGFKLSTTVFAKALIASLIMAAVLFMVISLHIITLILVAIAIYLLSLKILKVTPRSLANEV